MSSKDSTFIPMGPDGKQMYSPYLSWRAKLEGWFHRGIYLPLFGTTIVGKEFTGVVITGKNIRYLNCRFVHCTFSHMEGCLIKNSSIVYEGPVVHLGEGSRNAFVNCMLRGHVPKGGE